MTDWTNCVDTALQNGDPFGLSLQSKLEHSTQLTLSNPVTPLLLLIYSQSSLRVIELYVLLITTQYNTT